MSQSIHLRESYPLDILSYYLRDPKDSSTTSAILRRTREINFLTSKSILTTCPTTFPFHPPRTHHPAEPTIRGQLQLTPPYSQTVPTKQLHTPNHRSPPHQSPTPPPPPQKKNPPKNPPEAAKEAKSSIWPLRPRPHPSVSEWASRNSRATTTTMFVKSRVINTF